MNIDIGDVLLVWRFDRSQGDHTASYRSVVSTSKLTVYAACQGNECRMYAAPAAQNSVESLIPTHARLSRLRCTLTIEGAAFGSPAPWHYVVETDVLSERETNFNAWYDEEHLPGLAAVPGTVRASRFICEDPRGPRYYACYDLASDDVFGSAAWLAVRSTAWSSSVRPAFRNTSRAMFKRL